MTGTTPAGPVLDVRSLRVSFGTGAASRPVVHDLDLRIEAGQCVAIVGESGSGKSVTARTLLGLAGSDASVHADRLEVGGAGMLGAGEREWRRMRGVGVGLVLQDALVSLDPLRTIGREIGDTLRLHRRMPPAAARARVLELLELVGMPDPATAIDRRSGELSGGMRQRALIASAIALDPPLLIADEPTTALDVGVQARVLALLAEARDRGTGILLISHDLAVVSALADRIIVLDDGVVVEEGSTTQVITSPRHPTTRALVAAVPTEVPRGVPLTLVDRPLVPPRPEAEPAVHREFVLEGRSVSKSFSTRGSSTLAVDDVSIGLHRGRTLGLVGESGSGKTTVARMMLAIAAPDTGEVLLDGSAWSSLTERERRPLRPRIGAIYQDALGSFDPRWSVERILRDALGPASSRSSVIDLLDQVRLAPNVAPRHPLTLSGGQRQRVSIARALAEAPEILVCDEPVSALDTTVQARVLDLLDELQRDRGLSLLFISHDLGVVRHMSDSVAVMRSGRIVEHGATETVFTDPQHEYTRSLIHDAPRLRSLG
ncbi:MULTISPECIES: ATP-binding cassette domain-containing protein [unclassified Leifsonia]|uniref:ATP-binding cassette domain-containing protein n=1 Tax=unclassified Leifsonia TaxID=2663824 RepID=UPI0006FFCA8F|nr:MULTISPECIES: ABC transporter ATP-binding protein [unclassified Leifsonia]KQX06872.1 ABC transporter ATP-binding protein [Leifsonia sp. Root1293]KRA11157.1 ABC transporter ATP-binding protein [Leifsonia sp. Root60]